jgi:hypothetical protein
MKNLENIIKENLHRKYQINESFEKISLEEDEDRRLDLTLEYLDNLVKEGYDDTQLEGFVNEQFEWFKKMFGFGNKSNTTQNTNQTASEKVASAATGGVWSQFKEYIIKKFLSYLGFKGPLASAVSTVLVETPFPDLVNVFKSREGCMGSSGKVAGGLLEAIVTYIIESGTEKDSTAYNFLRNSIFDALRNEGYDRKLGQFICNYAYKSKEKIGNNIR